MSNRVEYLTVFTDVCNTGQESFYPGTEGYKGKRWVDFTVPLDWLMKNLKVTRDIDVSVRLANYSVDKEKVLIDAINDGVVQFGW